jgi:serine/threonine protein phosphatase PrpC
MLKACDGLWDVMESQEAVDFIKLSMDTYHDPKKAATDLVDEAIKLGSMDNVSVLVIFWPSSLVPASPVPSPLHKQDYQPTKELVDISPSKLDILELRLEKQ